MSKSERDGHYIQDGKEEDCPAPVGFVEEEKQKKKTKKRNGMLVGPRRPSCLLVIIAEYISFTYRDLYK